MSITNIHYQKTVTKNEVMLVNGDVVASYNPKDSKLSVFGTFKTRTVLIGADWKAIAIEMIDAVVQNYLTARLHK